jgi:para-aminobenzoate synthetase component 1
MVSTISCELKPNTNFETIFAATFPPASMTGAPKIRAMQLIDDHENFRRGAYSGSIGFIEPNGDFDFNVVIRSIVYNTNNKHLSYSVGSAITAKCDAEKARVYVEMHEGDSRKLILITNHFTNILIVRIH